MKKIAVIMGSDSDFPVVEKAIAILSEFEVPFSVHVFSAHRTPTAVQSFAQSAADNNYGVIISAAGKAAHLGGVIASYTFLPVIGLPIKSSTLDGLDALLSTVQMPSGVPVATVAIDGAANAALLAIEILALSEDSLAAKLKEYRQKAASAVLDKNNVFEEKYKI